MTYVSATTINTTKLISYAIPNMSVIEAGNKNKTKNLSLD